MTDWWSADKEVTAQSSDWWTADKIVDDDLAAKPGVLSSMLDRGLQSSVVGLPGGSGDAQTVQRAAGAVTRGLAPVAGGAAVGAAIGAPAAGVGAIPGAVAGAGAAGLAMAVGDPLVSAANSLMGTNYAMPSQALNDLFTRLGVPEPATEAERVLQSVAAGASGAGAGVALGQTMARAGGQLASRVGGVMAEAPVAQIIGGGAAGGASQLAVDAGAGPLAQIGAGIAGGALGAGIGNFVGVGGQIVKGNAKIPTAAASDIAAANAAKIPALTSDVMPPQTYAGKWLGRFVEKIPFAGTGPVRASQQQARQAAVADLITEYAPDMDADFVAVVTKDLMQQRSSELQKMTKLKTDAIQSAKAGGVVPMAATTQAVEREIGKLASLNTKEVAPVIARLEDWKTAIQGQDIENIELLRKQLGESFKAPELSAVRSIGEKSLSSIYGPVVDDMRKFISQTGGTQAATKWAVANKRLSELAGDMKINALRSVLRTGDATPENVQKLLFSQKPSEIRALYSRLSDDGRQNARSAIIQRAAQKMGQDVNPDRFVNEVGRLGKSVGVFFTGPELRQVKGLARALDITRRAQQAGVVVSSGEQLTMLGGASALTGLFAPTMGATGAAAAAAGTLGTVGMAARAYESPAVRNLLLRLSNVKPGSSAEAGIVRDLAIAIQAKQNISDQDRKTQK